MELGKLITDANEQRDWRMYADLARVLIDIARPLYADEDFGLRLKRAVYIFDSTTVDLCLSLYDWAKFRRIKGAIKLHLQLQDRGCLPCWALVTEGRQHEVRVAQGLAFDPGTIVVMDRGYTDYRLFGRWTEQASSS